MTASPTPIAARDYKLVCRGCGAHHTDDGLLLACPEDHAPALLRTQYPTNRLQPREDGAGLYRYRDWLPTVRTLPGAPGSVVFPAERLGAELGLRDLWVAFGGYWPERGAVGETGSFKDLEAYTVLGRLPERCGPLVVSSAGNTGTAFAAACSRAGVPCVVVVPAGATCGMRLRRAPAGCVRLVALDDADYSDAIAFGRRVAALPGFALEGGFANVGRRDGLATVLYAAVEAIGSLPDVYVQAVGSGVGAIAVHEAAERLLEDSQQATPRLVLAQNIPFTPLVDAWHAGLDDLGERDGAEDRRNGARVHAKELANRFPPYGVTGGVRDVLRASGGDMLGVTNAAAAGAAALFARTEGNDVEPAAGVALAALVAAVAAGRVDADATVLLHVTGGGRARMAADHALVGIEPALRLGRAELDGDGALERVAALFDRQALAGDADA